MTPERAVALDSSASPLPSYMGVEPAPVRNAPPWMNTITGMGSRCVFGFQILRVRQFSPIADCGDFLAKVCGQACPQIVALIEAGAASVDGCQRVAVA